MEGAGKMLGWVGRGCEGKDKIRIGGPTARSSVKLMPAIKAVD
jgi:hypothetical protein